MWGATRHLIHSVTSVSFNPRTRVGCDGFKSLVLNSLNVSIHAPVWGATQGVVRRVQLNGCFNPRTRVGCDSRLTVALLTTAVSIHAPVWGATICHRVGIRATCFNPRTRVGCDLQGVTNATINRVSIHAPVWGATSI